MSEMDNRSLSRDPRLDLLLQCFRALKQEYDMQDSVRPRNYKSLSYLNSEFEEIQSHFRRHFESLLNTNTWNNIDPKATKDDVQKVYKEMIQLGLKVSNREM